jgi:hypothetical protein
MVHDAILMQAPSFPRKREARVMRQSNDRPVSDFLFRLSASSFSLLVQRKGTKRKDTLAFAPLLRSGSLRCSNGRPVLKPRLRRSNSQARTAPAALRFSALRKGAQHQKPKRGVST